MVHCNQSTFVFNMADERDEFTLARNCLFVCFDEGFMFLSTHALLICNFLLLVQAF